MSFKSLVKKLMKEGKSEEAATKIAGSIANAKLKGAGSGPTAKQKSMAKMKKSPAKKYDRVVLGGNKGDKSKTKPGNKDYSPAKMKKSPAEKELKGKQKNLPPELKAKIEASPAKKTDKKNIKRKMEKVISSKSKSKSNKNKNVTVDKKKKENVRTGDISKTKVKTKLNKNTGDYVTKKKTVTKGDSGRNKTKTKVKGNQQDDAFENMINAQFNSTEERNTPNPRFKKEENKSAFSPAKKSKQRVEQDYARNAIADYKAGDKKAANYEKKKALETAAGESPSTKKSMAYMKSNQDGGSYTAKKPGAAAKQLKKLGSILSKHMKSN